LLCSDIDLHISRRKNVFQDHRIGVPVGDHGADIPRDPKGFFNGLIERNESVVGANQRAIEIKENEPYHPMSTSQKIIATVTDR